LSAESIELRPLSASEALATESLAVLMRDASTLGFVGTVVVTLVPDAGLLRLRPEHLPSFYAAIHDLLRHTLRESDRVLRTDRFEWTILLPSLPSPAALTLAMLRLSRSFEQLQPQLLQFVPQIEVRLGGALFPEVQGDATHLIQSAKIACLEAERTSERYAQYQPEMESRARSQLRLSQDIAAALNAGGFDLFLQPQVNLVSGRCVGAELLLRWRRGEEWVPPPLVIGMVERAGLRQTFNRWLFHRAMQVAQGLDSAAIDIPLSLNLAAGDLQDKDLAMLLDQALRTFAVPARRIHLEITETALVNQTEAAQVLIGQLQNLGVELSIDDFGTGYSGMTHLRLLPVREIKIDQMFVRQIGESEIDRTIVRAILDLGKSLGLSVLAEGVETAAAARILHDMGCELAQGFLYARPMPLSDFVAWHQARALPTGG
jgi:EAL domain-containing protein (putative c-di-GMP-specific phosphodiesterase class I)